MTANTRNAITATVTQEVDAMTSRPDIVDRLNEWGGKVTIGGRFTVGVKEAAAEIQSLRAENERLRENLQRMILMHEGLPMTGIQSSQWVDEARAALPQPTDRCRECGGAMKPGKATEQTFVGGMPDFEGDTHSSTFSAGGPGKVIDCMKCSNCGWSVTEGNG